MKATDALRDVRRLAVANKIIFSGHARARMRQRFVLVADVRHALSNATDCRPADEDRWKVVGKDVDGDDLNVVVAIEGGVVVVTVF